jgi:organic hydroperoxide reductase OsmC/OhrA
MKISARIINQFASHSVALDTNGREHTLEIAPKADGFGSSANGGELLFLALATCYCNDLYREAKKRGIEIERAEVEVSGEFGAEGEAAHNVSYRADVVAKAPREQVLDLMRHTDSVAEIQNTLRRSVPVVLTHCGAREA